MDASASQTIATVVVVQIMVATTLYSKTVALTMKNMRMAQTMTHTALASSYRSA